MNLSKVKSYVFAPRREIDIRINLLNFSFLVIDDGISRLLENYISLVKYINNNKVYICDITLFQFEHLFYLEKTEYPIFKTFFKNNNLVTFSLYKTLFERLTRKIKMIEFLSQDFFIQSLEMLNNETIIENK